MENISLKNTSNYSVNTSNVISNRITSFVQSSWTYNANNIYYTLGKVGIGTTSTASILTINPIVVDRNAFDHSVSPLTITHQTATSTSVLNDPKEILHLCRQGTVSQSYGAKATFKLCRYENSSLASRTRLDINLAHNDYDDVNIMSIRSDGNVGIGITNPANKLHINAGLTTPANTFPLRISAGAASDTAGVGCFMGMSCEAGAWSKTAIGHVRTGPYDVGDIVFLNRNTQDNVNCDMTNAVMTIQKSGKVGIGITNPAYGLDVVNGNTYMAVFRHTNLTQGIGIGYNEITAMGTDATQDVYIKSKSSGAVRLNTDGSDRVIVDNGKTTFNVGSGTGEGIVVRGTNPTLYLKHSAGNRSAMVHCNGNILYILGGSTDSTTWSQVNGVWPLMIDLSNNNSTFGGIVNCTQLQINGTSINDIYVSKSQLPNLNLNNGGYADIVLGFGASGWHTANYGSISTYTISGWGHEGYVLKISSGNAYITMQYNNTIQSSTSISVASDERIKTSINTVTEDECINIIRNITMFKFKYKDIKRQCNYKNNYIYGFIAQDIKKYIPISVKKNSDNIAIPSIQKFCTITDDILLLENIEHYVDNFDNIYEYTYIPKINDLLEVHDCDNSCFKFKLQITDIINNYTFKVSNIDNTVYNESTKYFVYGNIINDYMFVEHDIIHNITTGAIKDIDRTTSALKNEIDILKNEITILKEQINLITKHIGL